METIDIITRYFPDLTTRQKEQLEALPPLYAEWNAKINVVSRRDIDNLYSRHILHSLAIAKFMTPTPETSILTSAPEAVFPAFRSP